MTATRGWVLFAGLVASALALHQAAAGEHAAAAPGAYRGWGYLVEKLVSDGVDRERVIDAFMDARVEPFTGLEFSLQPRESAARYRGFLASESVTAARECRVAHGDALAQAESRHGVPASVVAAILYVESGCGRNTGSSVVFHRLARLAMANEPANLRANVERLASEDGLVDPAREAQARARARYLEDTFYPEVRAAFVLAERLGINLLSLRGSPSGAFGYPQFLPSSYLAHAIDGDGDGRVSLYDPEDAVASCANYLAQYGWRAGLSHHERRKVIWEYNRSDAYIDTVLALADRIDGRAGEPRRRSGSPAGRRVAKRSVTKQSTTKRAGAKRGLVKASRSRGSRGAKPASAASSRTARAAASR